MARQNRVTPQGQIVADPGRGFFMGNRGILHGADGRLGRARYRSRAWITCVLAFKGRKLELAAPGHYTQLFFLDEAVAFAAGHRPCAECRRSDYNRFREKWQKAGLGAGMRAPEMDRCLHDARIVPRTLQQITHEADIADLPDGCFVASDTGPSLLRGNNLFGFTMAGYLPPYPRPRSGAVTVLTPAPLVRVLEAGYQLAYHPSAG